MGLLNNNELDVFFNEIFNDIKSDKPYSQQKYLQKFNKMYQDKSIYLNNNGNNNNIYSQNYHQNYYGSNNIQITGGTAETGMVGGFF
jgi:hypothetical protein